MKKFSADMKVVRFGAEDVIVTSGAADMVFPRTMGDSNPGGTVMFDGSLYQLKPQDSGSVNNLLGAIGTKYNTDANQLEIDCIDDTGSLSEQLTYEVYSGLDPRWVGSYMYDATNKKFTKKQ